MSFFRSPKGRSQYSPELFDKVEEESPPPSWSFARALDASAEDPSELAGESERRCVPGSRAMLHKLSRSGKEPRCRPRKSFPHVVALGRLPKVTIGVRWKVRGGLDAFP